MAQYRIYGTDEPYNGLTVEIGGFMYSTIGGALEGDSYQLYVSNVNNNNGNNGNNGNNNPLMDPNDPWADEEGGDIAPPIDPLFGTSTSGGGRRSY